MNIDLAILNAAIEDLKKTLKDGVLGAAIWDRATGLALAEYNNNPAATALFTGITEELTATLSSANYPTLKQHYFLDLEGGNIAMVIQHGSDILQGTLMDSTKINLGVLLAIVVPRMVAAVKSARGAA